MENNEFLSLNKIVQNHLGADLDGVRLFRDKNGEQVALVKYIQSEKPFQVEEVITYLNNEGAWTEVGHFNYSIKSGQYLYLWNIAITNSLALNRGIGSRMMNYVQELAKSSQCKAIEGCYYPNGIQNNQKTYEFYIRNGFSIYKEGYSDCIYKDVVRQKNLQKTKNEFEISEYPPFEKAVKCEQVNKPMNKDIDREL